MGCFIRVHGDPPPVQQPSPIQLASNHLHPITTAVQEVANKSKPFTQRAAHHHTPPQQVGEPVEDDLEESEMEGLIDTPEIIGPSLETFVQLPLPSIQPSSIPRPSPTQGAAPTPHPPPPPTPKPPPPGPPVAKTRQKLAKLLPPSGKILPIANPQTQPAVRSHVISQ